MDLIVPVHQLEIRYTFLLNFNAIIKEIASPFVPLATNFNFEQENSTKHTKLTLTFANDYYSIFVTYDRIIFRYEGNPEELKANNSFFEEPFLNIFNKLKEHKDFGKVTNFLFYTLYVKPKEEDKEVILGNFLKENLVLNKTNRIMSSPTDVSVILNKNVNNQQVQIRFGPYVGMTDLASRHAVPIFRQFEGLDKYGEMAEVSITESSLSNFPFSKYKETLAASNDLISNLW